MNRNEIMTMTAEELRLAIAKAKGLDVRRARDIPELLPGLHEPGLYKGLAEWITTETLILCNGGAPWFPPHWTTSIADAWELMEEIAAKDYPIPGICRMDENDNWNCYYRFAGDQGIEIVEADTAPLAICRAWLLWKTEAE